MAKTIKVCGGMKVPKKKTKAQWEQSNKKPSKNKEVKKGKK